MDKHYQNIAIVIPSLDPPPVLVSYIEALMAHQFTHIYVVNDGSDGAYDSIFQVIRDAEACTLLTHPHNRGKGAALKTAYRHIAQTFPQCRGIITADSDGQHAVKDVCRLADSLLDTRDCLILGGRNFSAPDVPAKSFFGNRISSFMFFLCHGTWVQDTQTGLRGFDISLLPEMLSIEGDRFEYEMAVLTTCASKKIPIQFISIDTIYINGNVGSHFRPLKDSARIGRVLLGQLGRFLLSSCAAYAVDITLCWTLLSLLAPSISSNLLRISLSVLLARTVSMLVNYAINRGFVYREASDSRGSFGRYLLLVILNMAAASALIYMCGCWLGWSERVSYVLVGLLLFSLNYQIQKVWVFPSTCPGGAT